MPVIFSVIVKNKFEFLTLVPVGKTTNFKAEEAQYSPKEADYHRKTDKRRQRGDFGVYKYYLASAGFTAVALYTLAVTIWVFCTEFPSKSNQTILKSKADTLCSFSYLAKLVV